MPRIRDLVKTAIRDDGATIIQGNLDFEMEGEMKDGFWMEPLVIEGIKFNSESFH